MINLAGERKAVDGEKGFTLIELLVSVAVLSVMGGLLIRGFVSVSRMNEKVFLEEQIRNEARWMMEEIKGYSPGKLEENGYHFSRQVELYGDFGGDSGGTYRIDAEVDPEYYHEENDYRMPDIADVEDPRNIVLVPGAFSGETVLDGEESGGRDITDIRGIEDIADEDDEYEDEENESESGRYLHLTVTDEISENGASGKSGTLKIRAEMVRAGKRQDSGKAEVTSEIYSWKRKLEFNDETGRPDNRIYVFLPELSDAAHFDKVFVTADGLTETYEMHVILAGGGGDMPEAEKYLVMVDGDFELYSRVEADFRAGDDFRAEIASASDARMASGSGDGFAGKFAWDEMENECGWNDRLHLYTNVGGRDLVARRDAEKRLYRVTVRVCGPSGREVMRLESTRREQTRTETERENAEPAK